MIFTTFEITNLIETHFSEESEEMGEVNLEFIVNQSKENNTIEFKPLKGGDNFELFNLDMLKIVAIVLSIIKTVLDIYDRKHKRKKEKQNIEEIIHNTIQKSCLDSENKKVYLENKSKFDAIEKEIVSKVQQNAK